MTFYIRKNPLRSMLLLEAVALNYPLKISVKESTDAQEEVWFEVHIQGSDVDLASSIKEYIEKNYSE